MKIVEIKTHFETPTPELEEKGKIERTYLIPLNQINYVYSKKETIKTKLFNAETDTIEMSNGVYRDYYVVFNKDEELEIDKDKFLEIKKLLESEDKDK